MRFSNGATAVLVSSAALLGNAYAHDAPNAEDDLESVVEPSTPASSSVSISKPSFTPLSPVPSSAGKPFFEQFTSGWDKRWKVSHAKKENAVGDEEWTYVGQWKVQEPEVMNPIHGDASLIAWDKAAHHAISAKFDKPFDNKGKDLVVQYEVKLQHGLDCGGAYLKLLRENKDLHANEFSNASPYVIMFGPDKCGSTNKVHFIFKHKNPITGEYEEKHLQNPPAARINSKTVLYTLIVRQDNTFQIKMDGEAVKNGTLLEDFTPPVNPAAEIEDKDDKKPGDWVDESMIADPEASKPEDWDEDAPLKIVDEEAEKPDDWLDNEPEMIPDPDAEKPEGWDDEEDGDWVAPMVPNPKCEEASGCGEWKKPMKDNPEYKGKWTAPMISNPEYKGVWKPQMIKNPDYFEDKNPSNMEPIGAIGFELWTMNNGIAFDNIYVGHSEKDAAAIQAKTWDIKHKIETEEDEASAPPTAKDEEKDKTSAKSPLNLNFKEDPVTYVKENLDLFITLAKKDLIEAVKFMPEFAAGVLFAFIGVLGLLIGILSSLGGSAPAKKPVVPTKTEKTTVKTETPVVAVVDETEATTTGAEQVKATKRGTTSKKE